MTLFNLDDLNSTHLHSIFNSIAESSSTPQNEKFAYIVLKNFSNEIASSKEIFKRISKLFQINLSIEQALLIVKSLELFDWNEINTNLQLIKVWFYCINNIYGENFLGNKYDGMLSEDFKKEEDINFNDENDEEDEDFISESEENDFEEENDECKYSDDSEEIIEEPLSDEIKKDNFKKGF